MQAGSLGPIFSVHRVSICDIIKTSRMDITTKEIMEDKMIMQVEAPDHYKRCKLFQKMI